MTGVVETSVFQILASNYYFPVVYFLSICSSFSFPRPYSHDNAEIISEYWLSQYGKQQCIYWRRDVQYKNGGMQSSVP